MLSPPQKREALAGKLLLSSALVAVSLAYGWWQRPAPAGPGAPIALTPAPKDVAMAPDASAASAPAVPPAAPPASDTAAPDEARAASAPADTTTRARKSSTAITTDASPATSTAITSAPAATQLEPSATPPTQPTSAPLTVKAALAMNLPTDEASPPLAAASGTPAPGLSPAIPAGTHLEDGDYLSDRHDFEWGSLLVKVSIHGGQITAVQILQYPDHRSQSLYLSQMAGPILESEVVKTQQSQVDAVSSATDTSYAFQDAIGSAIVKATRG